ncbi:MAG TPA: hypothetical protein VGY31_13300 [Terriglobia bacterium]|nr:hypothetical protein [Terriglobia bacterium]
MSSRIVNATPGHLPSILLEHDDRWKVALRVAASREFSKSTRLHDFLLYVCEKALTNRADEIREQVIGFDVFDRGPGYNPGDDNIVRVEARELRKRLDRYFEGEGAQEPYRISVPKGSYVPVFEPVARETALVEVSSPSLELSAEDIVHSAKTGFWRSHPGIQLSWSMLALIAAITVLLITQASKLGVMVSGFSANKLTVTPRQGSLWPLLFEGQRPVTIVAADSALVLVQDITHQVVPLSDYFSKSYFDKLSGPEVSLITHRPYTSLADAVVISELLNTAGAQHKNVAVRYARDLEMRDLENGNLVFLGSSYSDPWIREFDSERNFVVGVEARTRRLYFLNKSPKKGEADRYYAAGQTDRTNETYGLITYLPNLRHTGNVLILGGTSSEGTEAAGDFITDPRTAPVIRRYLKVRTSAASIPYFQLLIKTTTLDNTPSKLQVIASRIMQSLS